MTNVLSRNYPKMASEDFTSEPSQRTPLQRSPFHPPAFATQLHDHDHDANGSRRPQIFCSSRGCLLTIRFLYRLQFKKQQEYPKLWQKETCWFHSQANGFGNPKRRRIQHLPTWPRAAVNRWLESRHAKMVPSWDAPMIINKLGEIKQRQQLLITLWLIMLSIG